MAPLNTMSSAWSEGPSSGVLVLLICKSAHGKPTCACETLLAVPPGAGDIKPSCTESPSVSPTGVTMLLILVINVHCSAPMVAVMLWTIRPPAAPLPAGNVALPLIGPLPLVLPLTAPPGQLAPLLAVQVQLVKVSPAGTASDTAATALCAVVGACSGAAVLFSKVTVNVVVPPAGGLASLTSLIVRRSTSLSTMTTVELALAGAPQVVVEAIT